MRAIAIALDGVLRKPLDVEAQDFGAYLLYLSLIQNFRVVILGTADPAKDEHFLSINGMVKYVKIEPIRPEDGVRVEAQQRRQIDRLRGEGFTFEFVVVPDPDLATYLYSIGVPVLLYLHPTFSAKSFRPDYDGGIRPWHELAAEVEFQMTEKAKALAERTKDED